MHTVRIPGRVVPFPGEVESPREGRRSALKKDPIRLRVWLVVAIPVVVAGGVMLFVFGPTKKPAARSTSTATEAVEVVPAEVSSPPAAPAVAPSPAAATPVVSARVASAPPASSGELLRGPPPEPIPELDALYARPIGSDEWSADEKLAYRRKAFDDLRTKERSLQAEMTAADRAGDSEKKAEKQATLLYLQARRAQVERMLSGHAQGEGK